MKKAKKRLTKKELVEEIAKRLLADTLSYCSGHGMSDEAVGLNRVKAVIRWARKEVRG